MEDETPQKLPTIRSVIDINAPKGVESSPQLIQQYPEELKFDFAFYKDRILVGQMQKRVKLLNDEK